MMAKSETKMSATVRQKKGNVNKTVSVEEIENGFLIVRNTDWEDAKGQYHYETKKWYSESNPLDVDDNKELADYFK